MPLFFIIVGIALFAAGFRGKADDLATVTASEFQGDGTTPGFAVWALAIGSVAALGYVKEARPFSNALLVLVFASLLLSKAGQVTKAEEAVNNVVALVTNKGKENG